MNLLSQIIAEHVATARYAQLSSKAVQMTKYSLLDAIGVMFGASGIGEGCDAFVRQALEAEAKPVATILGYGVKTSASLAALANGAMSHALDFEDSHDSAPVHPNAQVIPAVLALAESLEAIDGQRLITAIAVGCDLTCRLGLCLKVSIDDYGWYSPPILGAFGATAATCHLLGLDARATLDAFSLTLCQVSLSSEIKSNAHTVMRSIRDAFAAQLAVSSAQLAQKGVRGFDAPLEGKAGFFNNFARNQYDPALLTNELGARFEGENLSFKPWPACRGTHAYIDAALELMSKHALKADDIALGHMIGHRIQKMLYEPLEQKRRPATAINAKFSLPFTVASALVRGPVTLGSYTAAALRDPAVLDLAERLTFEVSEDPKASDNATRGELILNMKSGEKYSLAVEHPLGHSSRPISEAVLVEKFHQCAELARKPMSHSAQRALAATVLSLEGQSDLKSTLFGLLSRRQ